MSARGRLVELILEAMRGQSEGRAVARPQGSFWVRCVPSWGFELGSAGPLLLMQTGLGGRGTASPEQAPGPGHGLTTLHTCQPVPRAWAVPLPRRHPSHTQWTDRGPSWSVGLDAEPQVPLP